MTSVEILKKMGPRRGAVWRTHHTHQSENDPQYIVCNTFFSFSPLGARFLNNSQQRASRTKMNVSPDNNDDEQHQVVCLQDEKSHQPGQPNKMKPLGKDEIFDVLSSRYFYSGGSARWMFHYTKSRIDRYLREFCEKAPNRKDILDGAIGPTSRQPTISLVPQDVKMVATNTFLSASAPCRFSRSSQEQRALLMAYPKLQARVSNGGSLYVPGHVDSFWICLC